MIWVDWVILSIIGLSALISLMRGFVREALSLAGWIAAFLVAKAFYEPVALLLEEHIETNSIRLGVAWVGLFVVTLFAAGLLNYIVGKLVDGAGLSGTDRLLGMVFGAVRGVLIVALIVLGLKQFTPVPQDKWWSDSALIPHSEKIAEWFYDHLKEVVPELEKEANQVEQKLKDTLSEKIIENLSQDKLNPQKAGSELDESASQKPEEIEPEGEPVNDNSPREGAI